MISLDEAGSHLATFHEHPLIAPQPAESVPPEQAEAGPQSSEAQVPDAAVHAASVVAASTASLFAQTAATLTQLALVVVWMSVAIGRVVYSPLNMSLNVSVKNAVAEYVPCFEKVIS